MRCLNSKHRQTIWNVSSEATGDIVNTKDVKNKMQYCLLKCIEVVLQVKTQELDVHLQWYGISLILV